MSGDITWREKVHALRQVLAWKPLLTAGIIGFSAGAAVLEGVGLSFIIPIIETGTGEPPEDPGGVLSIFISAYDVLNIPFTLGYLILGVGAIMTIRYSASFVAGWLQLALRTHYEKHLRTIAYRRALHADVRYYDSVGSDDVLNAIITESRYSAETIRYFMDFMQKAALVLMYLVIAFYLSPPLTILTLVLLGVITYVLRGALEPGYVVGNRVADANERVQQAVQAGTQGIRDVKLFTMGDELYAGFRDAVQEYADSTIVLGRNELAIDNGYKLSIALTVFALIYVAIVYTALSLGELGLFLFAMFQLGPMFSSVNKYIYQLEGHLSHLVRTQTFLDELEQRQEGSAGDDPAPDPIERLTVDRVWFSYASSNEEVLKGLSFEIESGEFIGFVGKSGAGKSTIVSLITRMYSPDRGEIRANGTDVRAFELDSWRQRIAVVRQDPFIFNATLEYNLTIGNRDVSRSELDRVCRIARVEEFFEALPNGYETQLGEDGTRLSGGQRQRVALARALLTDADLLILDEATSDLDSNLEREVQQAIETMSREYAIVAIAHRLSTVKNADRIYTVDDGEIVETGSHHELLENDGKYSQLYAIQSQQ